MSLLKQLLTEEAAAGSTGSDKIARIVKETAATGAVGAHAIAGARGSLFGGGVVDHAKMVRRSIAKAGHVGKIKYESSPAKMHFLRGLLEANEGQVRPTDNEKFDPKDVLSKLDSAQKKNTMGEDTVCFGMEDEEGNIIKVHVDKEQAEDFESALAQMLNGTDEDDETTAPEIAEVLFKLRDKFSIVDVEWPEIPEDMEEDQEADAGEEGDMDMTGGEEGGDANADPNADPAADPDADPDAEGGDDMDMTADTSDDADQGAANALTQVIDMMKADAEAKQAEAEARTAEAKARSAEALSKTTSHKVAAEEQILDMETHEKGKKAEKDEATQLAKLAKFRHETKGATTKNDFMDPGAEEDEEATTINIKDFANLLKQHMSNE